MKKLSVLVFFPPDLLMLILIKFVSQLADAQEITECGSVGSMGDC